MSRSDAPPSVRLTRVAKSFGSIQALDGVDLEAHSGEVLAIVGDNGAGKSTLLNVLTGILQPDHGTVEIAGARRMLRTPADARAAGIAAVTQDLALVECLDVATNMFIGQTPQRFGLVDRARMLRESRAFLREVRSTIQDVRVPVGMLSGGQRQMVAIARALRIGSPVVVMDEPTAALGVRETAKVRDLIRHLRDDGRAVIVVSHDLSLVFDVADRIQVMRLGRVAGLVTRAEASRETIVGLITGAVAGEAVRHG